MQLHQTWLESNSSLLSSFCIVIIQTSEKFVLLPLLTYKGLAWSFLRMHSQLSHNILVYFFSHKSHALPWWIFFLFNCCQVLKCHATLSCWPEAAQWKIIQIIRRLQEWTEMLRTRLKLSHPNWSQANKAVIQRQRFFLPPFQRGIGFLFSNFSLGTFGDKHSVFIFQNMSVQCAITHLVLL